MFIQMTTLTVAVRRRPLSIVQHAQRATVVRFVDVPEVTHITVSDALYAQILTLSPMGSVPLNGK